MFNPDSKGYRFLRKNLMLRRNDGWDTNGDSGKGDALLRTGEAYIAYGDKRLKSGILSCFRKFTMIGRNKYWYQGARYCSRYREDDVSRDQTILALSAFKINCDKKELKEIGLHLPYRLSRRFTMTPTLWFWIRAIIYENKFYTYLYQIFQLIEFLPSVLWDKVLRKMMGWDKEYSQEWYLGYSKMPFWFYNYGTKTWKWVSNTSDLNNGLKLYYNHKRKMESSKFYRLMHKLEYPEFALHLTSWMIYTSNNTFIKSILQKLAIWLAEKDNLLVRLLMNDKNKVTMDEINKFRPVKGFRWSTRFNGNDYTEYLKGGDAISNTIGKDVLLSIYSIKNKDHV